MKKTAKGHLGYIKSRKKSLILRTLILAAGVLILLIIGYIKTGTKNNLLTVAAVVSVLPAVNQLVVLVALWPFKGREESEYKEITNIVGKGVLDVELVLTSKEEKTMQVDYAYVHNDGVFCYSENGAGKKIEAYMNRMLKQNDLNTKIKVFHEWKPFLNCLKGLTPEDRDQCEEKLLQIEGVLRALSI